jgi:hypothetical protein
MKKPTRERRKYQIIVTKKRTRRALQSESLVSYMQFLRTGQRGQRHRPRNRQRKRTAQLDDSLVLAAPMVFSLNLARERAVFLDFLGQLRHATLVAKRRVCIDFTNTERMFPEATLLFAAELDRIILATAPHSRVRCRYPANDVIEQLLQHLGLLDMMKAKKRAEVSADNVKHWQVASGVDVDGSRTEPIIEEYARLFSTDEAARMYRGLVEAMNNCKHHAYRARREDGTGLAIESRWWMLCQEKDGHLFVALCDLGIGIRRSLMQGRRWTPAQIIEMVKSLGGRRDSTFIKAAILLGRSRTNEEYRGKGLQDIRAVFDEMQSGWLRISSNRGTYSYSAETRTEKLHEHSGSILGTLVAWLVPLPKKDADDRVG